MPVCVYLYAGRGIKVETILKYDETLTSYLLRDVPLTESVVTHLVNAHIRPEQVRKYTPKYNLEYVISHLKSPMY